MTERHLALLLSLCMIISLLAGGGLGLSSELPPACEKLSGEHRELALGLMASEYPYDCCDHTLEKCLQQEPFCRLSWRLAESICRRVGEGQEEDGIRRALSRRARSMLPAGSPAEIDLQGAPALGVEEAPVEVVIYACARCPFCSKLIPQLEQAVTSGPLQSQARLYLRVFPIRGHPFSKEGGLAFVAAARQGLFWEYVLHAYSEFDGFRVDELPAWAEDVGMQREVFERDMADPSIREALVASKKEGLRNGVEATPTLFISRRPYVGDLTLEELVDVIGEEADNLRGEIYGEPPQSQPGGCPSRASPSEDVP
jgi:protein-disulfide isomerase